MKLLSQDSIADHLKYLTERGMSPLTVKAYKADLTQFSEWAGKVPDLKNLEDVAAQWLTAHRDEWAPRTIARRRSAIRRYALQCGAGKSFLQDYRAPTAAPLEAHPLPGGIGDVIKMVEVCSDRPHFRALVTLCGLMGLRVAEACSVRPSHFKITDDEDGSSLIRAKLMIRGKGAKVRVVPVTKPVFDHLHPRILACVAQDDLLVPMHVGSARRAISRIGAEAGLSGVSSHDLRMTFGSSAYAETKDLRAVQTLLGHSSPDTTVGYTAIGDDALTAAADLLR